MPYELIHMIKSPIHAYKWTTKSCNNNNCSVIRGCEQSYPSCSPGSIFTCIIQHYNLGLVS